MVDAALALDQVSAGYGRTLIVEQISMTIGEGASVAIIGRNGVGKTTLLETIMGHTTPHGGRLWLSDKEITRMPPHLRCRAGIGYVPQAREIFASLSVEENLAVAVRPGRWTIPGVLKLFPQLAERRGNRGNQLSGGEQQMLAIGRALVGNPRLLLMDEPSEGLAPVIVEQLAAVLDDLRENAGMTMVLVEQNARLALEFADRCLVMDRGQISHDGPSATLQRQPELLQRLIGVN